MGLLDCIAPQYKRNFFPFYSYIANHREHQYNAYEIALSNKIGQILSPCGTGKTRIQVSLHVQDMMKRTQRNQRGTYIIASHRLTLNQQLLEPIVNLAISCGLPFDVLFVGSGRNNLINFFNPENRKRGFTSKICNTLSTISRSKIEQFIKQSIADKRHTIIASTYDSINLLSNIDKIALCTNDEAHNTTSKEFSKNILAVKPNIEREYFFTATRKVAGEDDFMNDKDFYGDILIDICPSEMILAGEIACPRIHAIDSVREQDETNIENIDMLTKNTIEAFTHHKLFVDNYSFDKTKLGSKLLISCSSIDQMKKICVNNILLNFCKNNKIKLLAISSDGCYFNGEPCKKEQLMDQLNNLLDIEDAIIANVDILTEGIDLPAITGVMPMRNMSKTKLFQLLGRALRLHKEDRYKLYSNTLKPCNFTDYIKPYGWLVIPKHLSNLTEKDKMLEIVEAVISEYKTPTEEVVIQDRFIKYNINDLDSILPPIITQKRQFDLNHHEDDILSILLMKSLANKLHNKTIVDKKQLLESML